MTNEHETILIEKVLNNGQGMARLADGRVLMVPDALGGEQIRIEAFQIRKGVAWATRWTRLTDSGFRATPACPHYGACGGCQLLHIKTDQEILVKVNYFEDVLRRVGKLTTFEIETQDFAPSLSRIRGKCHVDAEGRVGFKSAAGSAISGIDSCLVLPPSLLEIFAKAQSEFAATGFSDEIYFATGTQGELPVLELTGRPATIRAAAGRLRRFDDLLAGVAKGGGTRSNRMIWGRNTVDFQWNRWHVSLEPSVFFQSNPASWPVFFARVGAYLEQYQPKSVWDVHAGAGFLTSCLEGRKVLASEPEPRAFGQLERVNRSLGLGMQIFSGTAEACVEAGSPLLSKLEGAILDPPRSGLTPRLTHWLIEAGPPSLLYFSCDMASFARDLRQLGAAYRMAGPILAMNVNPGTLRLESVVSLERTLSPT